MVLAVVSDLLLASKLTAELRARGLAFTWLRKPEQLEAAPAGATLLVVDCHLPGAVELAGAYKRRSPTTRVAGFASHTDGQTIAQARAAGVERVLARSAFFERPEAWLPATD